MPPTQRDIEIEAGKQIVKDVLRSLALELHRPEIAELSFAERTFDEPEHVSLVDSTEQVAMRIKGDHLADASTTPPRKQQLKAEVRVAVINFFERE